MASTTSNLTKQSKRGTTNSRGSRRGNGSRGGTPTAARGSNLSLDNNQPFSPSLPDHSPELIRRGEKAQLVTVSVDVIRSIEVLKLQLAEVIGENIQIKETLNSQQRKIVQLEQDLDDLQQYGRRENVCFTNLKFGDDAPVMQQVIDLCDEINVTVTDTDFVDVHPLPVKNGRAKRVVARFKDRKLAQKVMAARKGSKNINPTKKAQLAADPNKGFGIQPNITPKRSALLAQAKSAVEHANLNGTWIDTKTGAVLLRLRDNDRPRVIRNTRQLMEAVPSFVPSEYIFCLRDSSIFINDYAGKGFTENVLSGNLNQGN